LQQHTIDRRDRIDRRLQPGAAKFPRRRRLLQGAQVHHQIEYALEIVQRGPGFVVAAHQKRPVENAAAGRQAGGVGMPDGRLAAVGFDPDFAGAA